MIKYIYQNKRRDSDYDEHWEYCSLNKIPFIQIIKSGTEFWKIEFDVFPIVKLEQIVVINFADHVIPLYLLYSKYRNLNKNNCINSGGGRNLILQSLIKRMFMA